jgi:hypothetical protein
MLVVLPDEGLVVTDVSVVHPATNSFLQQAARAAGAAASLRDASKFLISNMVEAGRQLLRSPLHGFLRAPERPAMQLLQTLASSYFDASTVAHQLGFSRGRSNGAHSEWQFQGKQTSQDQQPSKLRPPKIQSIQTVTCIRNYNTAHNDRYKTVEGPLWTPCRSTASSGIHMQSFPILYLIPFNQWHAELAKSSSHKGGGSDVRPSRRRGGSSRGQGLQKLHRRPA